MANRFCNPGQGTGSNNGTSWEDAYQTWSAFTAAYAAGDVGYVKENSGIEITTEWDASGRFEIYFGMPSGLSGTDTTLIGRAGWTRFYSNGTSSRRWAFIDGLAADSILLDRLFLENFYRNDYGGGIYFYRSPSISLETCIFKNCKGTTRGGAFYNDASTVSNVLNINSTRMLDCKSTEGAAAYFYRAKTTLKNCVVSGCNNSGSAAASILYCSGMTNGLTVVENTIAGNSSTNIIKGNPVSYIGDTIIYGNTGTVALGNASTVINSCYNATLGGTGHTLTNNTSDDPAFLGSGDDPYQLSASSPTSVTQGGSTSVTGYVATDIFGYDRDASTPSMGAYEYGAGGTPGAYEDTLNAISLTVSSPNLTATLTGPAVDLLQPLDAYLSTSKWYWNPPSKLGFRDILTDEYCFFVLVSNQLRLFTSSAIDGTFSYVAGDNISHDGQMYSMCQDSSGYLHIIHRYGGDYSYSRITLTRTDNVITGWTFDGYTYLPNRNGTWSEEGVAAACIAKNGSNVDRLIVSFINGDGDQTYSCQVCNAPLTITATSDFANLSGTANAWTTVATRTQDNMTINFAGHWFKSAIEPYGSSGNLFVAFGPSGQDDKDDYGCAIEGVRLLASGSTWSVDSTIETLSANSYESLIGTSWSVNGNAYFSSSNKASQLATGNLYVSKIASDGTFTQSLYPTLEYGDYGTEPNLVVKVMEDERCYLIELPVDYANTSSVTQARYHYYNGNFWQSGRFSDAQYDGDRWSGVLGPTDPYEGVILVACNDIDSFNAAIAYVVYYPAGDSVDLPGTGTFSISSESLNVLISYVDGLSSGVCSFNGLDVNVVRTIVDNLNSAQYESSGLSVDAISQRLDILQIDPYTYSGINVNSIRVYVDSVDIGSYSLNGTSLDVFVDHSDHPITIEYLLEGLSVDAVLAYVDGLNNGDYTILGLNASVVHIYNDTLNEGIFASNGLDVNALYHRNVQLESVQATYSGITLNDSYNHLDLLLSLEYGVLGANINVIRGVLDSVDPVVGLVSLADIDVLHNYSDICLGLGYSFSGISVVGTIHYEDFLNTLEMAYDSLDVNTEIDRVDIPEYGVYISGGLSVDVTYVRLIVDSVESINILYNGEDVDALRSYVDSPGSGSYTINGLNVTADYIPVNLILDSLSPIQNTYNGLDVDDLWNRISELSPLTCNYDGIDVISTISIIDDIEAFPFVCSGLDVYVTFNRVDNVEDLAFVLNGDDIDDYIDYKSLLNEIQYEYSGYNTNDTLHLVDNVNSAVYSVSLISVDSNISFVDDLSTIGCLYSGIDVVDIYEEALQIEDTPNGILFNISYLDITSLVHRVDVLSEIPYVISLRDIDTYFSITDDIEYGEYAYTGLSVVTYRQYITSMVPLLYSFELLNVSDDIEYDILVRKVVNLTSKIWNGTVNDMDYINLVCKISPILTIGD